MSFSTQYHRFGSDISADHLPLIADRSSIMKVWSVNVHRIQDLTLHGCHYLIHFQNNSLRLKNIPMFGLLVIFIKSKYLRCRSNSRPTTVQFLYRCDNKFSTVWLLFHNDLIQEVWLNFSDACRVVRCQILKKETCIKWKFSLFWRTLLHIKCHVIVRPSNST